MSNPNEIRATMTSKIVSATLLAIPAVIMVLLVLQNSNTVTLSIFGTGATLSNGAMAAVFFLFGLATGICAMLPFLKNVRREASDKLKEWQAQDHKLLTDIQSDKEKQLEAKIQTLEVALKQALNRP